MPLKTFVRKHNASLYQPQSKKIKFKHSNFFLERNDEIIRANNILLKRMEGILMQNSYRQFNSRFRKKSLELLHNNNAKRETPVP